LNPPLLCKCPLCHLAHPQFLRNLATTSKRFDADVSLSSFQTCLSPCWYAPSFTTNLVPSFNLFNKLAFRDVRPRNHSSERRYFQISLAVSFFEGMFSPSEIFRKSVFLSTSPQTLHCRLSIFFSAHLLLLTRSSKSADKASASNPPRDYFFSILNPYRITS